MKVDLCLSTCANISSMWIKETLQLLKENLENTLSHVGICNNFLNRTPRAQQLIERMDKQDCIKLRSLCTVMETVTRLKKQLTEWKKILASYLSDKGLII
jgi:hypothetical protein